MEKQQSEEKELLNKLASEIRKFGFKGSGQNFRKAEGDFISVINIQKSRAYQAFYINLGAQPVFIPAEGEITPDPKKLKEYECILRSRIGDMYSWTMSEVEIEELIAKLDSAQRTFFGRAQRLRAAIETDSPEDLLRDFSAGTTAARATLHLARACEVLEQHEKAASLVYRGLELAGPQASSLRAQLKSVLPKTRL